MADNDPDVRWMTYAEAAAALGVNPESVARRMRRDGWARRQGNDNRPRVAVPVKLLPVPDVVQDTGPDKNPDATPSVPDSAGLMMALAFQAQAAAARAERAEVAHLAASERAAAAEAALAEVREALAREMRQAEQAEAARRVAEAELTAWTEGGPIARAWRAFLARRTR